MIHFSLSSLSHTGIIDLDGTIVKHNGHKQGGDELLHGVLEFFLSIPSNDIIILLTAREEQYSNITTEFLIRNGIRFNQIIFGMPTGERILINDLKPSGLQTAYAFNVERDAGLSSLSMCLVN